MLVQLLLDIWRDPTIVCTFYANTYQISLSIVDVDETSRVRILRYVTYASTTRSCVHFLRAYYYDFDTVSLLKWFPERALSLRLMQKRDWRQYDESIRKIRHNIFNYGLLINCFYIFRHVTKLLYTVRYRSSEVWEGGHTGNWPYSPKRSSRCTKKSI